jgi:hypothetical protein
MTSVSSAGDKPVKYMRLCRVATLVYVVCISVLAFVIGFVSAKNATPKFIPGKSVSPYYESYPWNITTTTPLPPGVNTWMNDPEWRL